MPIMNIDASGYIWLTCCLLEISALGVDKDGGREIASKSLQRNQITFPECVYFRLWEMNADQFADQGIVIFTLSALVPSILQTN